MPRRRDVRSVVHACFTRSALTLVLAALVAPSARGAGRPTFASPSRINTVGTTPNAVFVADQDGDGKQDIVVANADDNTLSFLRGRGDATFEPRQDFATGAVPQGVLLVDLNGDGYKDLVNSNSGGPNVSVRLATGPATFSATRTDYFVGMQPMGLSAGFFNPDGFVDVAVALEGSGTVAILLGNGIGGLGMPTSYAAAAGCHDVKVALLNPDMFPDLVTINVSAGSVSVLLGTGSGSFGAPTSYSCAASPSGVALGDVNEDGVTDVLVDDAAGNVSTFPGAPSGTLGARSDQFVGAPLGGIVAAYFDGDSHLDVAVAERQPGQILIYHGAPTGPLQYTGVSPTGFDPRALASADFDGNGRLDLVATTYLNTNGMGPNREGAATLLLGRCDGAFGVFEPYASGINPYSMAVADVNGDLVPDVVMTNYGVATVTVELGASNRTLLGSPASYVTDTEPRCIALGDLNNDNKLDIVTGNNFTTMMGPPHNSVSVLLGNGDGTFQAHADYPAPGFPTGIQIADVTGDGIADVVTCSSSNLVTVYPGLGGGMLGMATSYPAGNSPSALQIGRMNADAFPDLVVVNAVGGNVSVFLNQTMGVFNSHTEYATGASPVALTLADLTGDGRPDVATANANSDNVTVLLNDGSGGLGSRADYPVGTTPYAITSADFNADGLRDLAVASLNSRKISVLTHVGMGFDPHMDFGIGNASPYTVSALDLDSDGRSELAVTTTNSQVEVLRNLTDQTAGFPLSTACQASGAVTCHTPYHFVYAITNLDLVPEAFHYMLEDPSGWITGSSAPLPGTTPALKPGESYTLAADLDPASCTATPYLRWVVDCGSHALLADSCTTFMMCSCPSSVDGAATPSLSLSAASPNPFRASTRLRYRITARGEVSLAIYAADGRRVRTLLSGVHEAGEGSASLDARHMPAGVYFARLTMGSEKRQTTLVLLK